MRAPLRYDVVYDPRFESLTRGVLEKYARGLGWVPYEGRDCIWRNPEFVGKSGYPFILTIVPDDAEDFYQRASEMIRQLSQYEDKTEKEILDELVALLPPPAAKRKPAAKPKPHKKVVAE